MTSCTAKPYKRFSTSVLRSKMKPWNQNHRRTMEANDGLQTFQSTILCWVIDFRRTFMFFFMEHVKTTDFFIDHSPGLGSIRSVRITKRRSGESGTEVSQCFSHETLDILPILERLRETSATSSLEMSSVAWHPDPLQEGCEDWSL